MLSHVVSLKTCRLLARVLWFFACCDISMVLLLYFYRDRSPLLKTCSNYYRFQSHGSLPAESPASSHLHRALEASVQTAANGVRCCSASRLSWHRNILS